jgi:ADP-heptose:LPS heptosyltransferase
MTAQRILVHRLGSLGDMCVALPALRVVRQAFPQAKIALLTNLPVNVKAAPAPALLDGISLVDDYIAYPVGTRSLLTLSRLFWQLRRQRFDAVVNLTAWRGAPALRRDARFFRICGIRQHIGFDAKAAGELRSDGRGHSEHEAGRLLRRVSGLGQTDLGQRCWYGLELTRAEHREAQAILHHAGMPSAFVAFSVGTKLSVNDWEQTRWVQLLAALAKQLPQHGCVAIGTRDESLRADECLAAWHGPKANFCGDLPPRGSAAVLSRANVFIGHDSGPMHLAAAVGTPCVAIFSGRNPPGQWFPLGEGHEVLYRRVECTGCGLDDCIAEQKRCIRSITIDEVASAVLRQLERSRNEGVRP